MNSFLALLLILGLPVFLYLSSKYNLICCLCEEDEEDLESNRIRSRSKRLRRKSLERKRLRALYRKRLQTSGERKKHRKHRHRYDSDEDYYLNPQEEEQEQRSISSIDSLSIDGDIDEDRIARRPRRNLKLKNDKRTTHRSTRRENRKHRGDRDGDGRNVNHYNDDILKAEASREPRNKTKRAVDNLKTKQEQPQACPATNNKQSGLAPRTSNATAANVKNVLQQQSSNISESCQATTEQQQQQNPEESEYAYIVYKPASNYIAMSRTLNDLIPPDTTIIYKMDETSHDRDKIRIKSFGPKTMLQTKGSAVKSPATSLRSDYFIVNSNLLLKHQGDDLQQAKQQSQKSQTGQTEMITVDKDPVFVYSTKAPESSIKSVKTVQTAKRSTTTTTTAAKSLVARSGMAPNRLQQGDEQPEDYPIESLSRKKSKKLLLPPPPDDSIGGSLEDVVVDTYLNDEDDYDLGDEEFLAHKKRKTRRSTHRRSKVLFDNQPRITALEEIYDDISPHLSRRSRRRSRRYY